MAYSVFISYSTRELATANALREWITSAGAQACGRAETSCFDCNALPLAARS
jgi:hypothetical protein